MTERARAIAVFGSSEPGESDPLYSEARRVGRLLALEGFVVVTGGYGGIMEAASRGAVESGGRALGITTRAFSSIREAPNRYLTDHVETADLHERTRELIDRCTGYIILRGKAGTLAELTFLWALHRAGLLGDRPIVLLGAFWQGFLDSIGGFGLLDGSQADMTRVARTPEEAIAAILDGLR